METGLKLNIAQRQQQTLAPLQMQFVRVLEMNGPEIEEQVRETLDENPALEVAEEGAEHEQEESFNESAEQIQLADYRTEDDVPTTAFEAKSGVDSSRYFEPVATAHGDSLMESLMRQLNESDMPADDLTVAEYIIGSLDDNGYLTRPLPRIADDLAMMTGIDASDEQMRRVWEAIRALDPAGVGAVDLRDCLLLQLRRKRTAEAPSPIVDKAIEMVSDYFDLFSRMHFERLRSALGIDSETMKQVYSLIRTLNPKPGSLVSGNSESDRTRQISPDFLVEYDTETGRISLTLPNRLPQLQISQSFAADAPTGDSRGAQEASLFIRQRRDEASTFIQALAMRQQTLFNVMQAIIKIQHDFFTTDDPSRLKPMVLKDIAEITGYDLSVISRATAGKYVATDRGIYPLRFFFSERPNENTDASTHKITDALKRIIKQEDPRSPLSDAAITDMLREQGFDLARRTVAKYRERLGFPVGRLRKKL